MIFSYEFIMWVSIILLIFTKTINKLASIIVINTNIKFCCFSYIADKLQILLYSYYTHHYKLLQDFISFNSKIIFSVILIILDSILISFYSFPYI